MRRTHLGLMMMAVAVLASGPVEAKRLWAKSFLGHKPPHLVVEKWLTPEPKTKGKFVLIDFWATWCGPCREAIGELNKIHEKYGNKVVIIGISDESEKDVRAMTKPAIEYSVAIDTKSRTKDAIGVTGIPHVILMDPTGIVRWEGFPLLDGYNLTPDVVGKIIHKYSKRAHSSLAGRRVH